MLEVSKNTEDILREKLYRFRTFCAHLISCLKLKLRSSFSMLYTFNFDSITYK